ncbi:hypothetical protein FB451DRAFT_1262770 [Mycena latifolia]|nr:hypothetical protein FB451DRAFT_1262770 [Mycena latifolia]
MAGHVPDEIIHEILCPALRVPDEAFSATRLPLSSSSSSIRRISRMTSTSRDSPFVSVVESSSAFLLVSKSWLRVGTPLLYNVVIIRSKAQAQALAIALRSNPDLGRFIKKLRVEGGYAISMHKILQASKNITDLYLALDIAKSDNACGLCRGLPLIDPVRVILHSPRYWVSTEEAKLVEVLQECIQKWKNLAVFETSHLMDGSPSLSSIYHALKNAKSLNTLIISDSDPYLFQEEEVPRYILTIAANPSLQHIRPKPRPTHDVTGSYFVQALRQHVRLQALFELMDPPTGPPIIESPTIPFFYPAALAADPELEDRIWSRVLYYVISDGHLSSRSFLRSTILAPLLVSKKFARLGIPHLYENPILDSTLAMHRFTERLDQQRMLGPHVRRLTIRHPDGYQALANILSGTPSLVELVCAYFAVTWKVFNDICNMTGSTLRTVQVPVEKSTIPMGPGILSQLPRLRCFTWNSEIVFKTAPELISGGTFDALVDLSLEVFDPSFLTVLAHLELPSLRIVTFSANSTGGNLFFEKHEKKLLQLTVSVPQINSNTLILRHCPSMTLLVIFCEAKSVPRELSEKQACLERIVFKSPAYFSLQQTQKTKFDAFFSHIDRTQFPALREIQHPGCTWPTTEHEISKSSWVTWAEALLKHSIHLVDEQGVRWRPRLKFIRKSAKKR